MKYTQLPGTDLTVSQIALGTWAIGDSHWGACDDAQSEAAIDVALENGINIIDTAPAYGNGHAEELLSKILRDRRHQVVIATKCGLEIEDNYKTNLSPAHMEYELYQSLRRLGTDYIDLYQCHWPDPKTPIAETMETMLRFRKEGKIRYFGVSNFNNEQIEECLSCAPITTLQAHYSLLERSIENGTQQTCTSNSVAIIPYGPLGGGMLTGKYTELPSFRKDDPRSFFYRFFGKSHWPRVKTLLDTMSDIAALKKAKPSHIALAWLLARPGVCSVLAGARSPEQVQENIGALAVTLTPAETDLLDRLSQI